MCERITPPKIVPRAFVSLGSSSTLIAGIRSGATAQDNATPQRRQPKVSGLPAESTVPRQRLS